MFIKTKNFTIQHYCGFTDSVSKTNTINDV